MVAPVLTVKDTAADRPSPVTRGSTLRAPVLAGALLLGVYLALSCFMSPRGFLGTDTGGKVATVQVMSERGDFDPDVGYWAAPWDPDGRVHGLYYTSRLGDRYLQVTSLPMVLLARPLWDLGGYRATLLLPMLGGVATAFAARALARRLAPGEGWTAFWVIGLASPVAVYALDLWEHSLGLALMGWAGVALFDAVERRPTWWRGLGAGLLFGAAAAMRTEAFVYAFAMIGVACVAITFGRHRSLRAGALVGASAIAGLALAFGANLALETAVVGEQIRSSRAGGAAVSGGSQALVRVQEAMTTLVSPYSGAGMSTWVIGGALAALVIYGARKATQPHGERQAALAASLVVAIYLTRLLGGLGFVPGMIAATPFAAVGLALGWRAHPARLVLLMGLAPLPFVFAFQYVGGAGPQWAGRYLLTSGLLLAVVGIAEARRMLPWARVSVVVASVVITAFGMGWLAVRSHAVAEAGAQLAERPEEVLISPNGFLPREFGATYGDHHWLSSGSAADLDFAVRVAGDSGAATFGLVVVDPTTTPPAFPGWSADRSEEFDFLAGSVLRVTTYIRR